VKRVDLLDLPDDVRALVGECEVTGRRTTFTRAGRDVAVLVSHDEYLALRETIDVARNPTIIAGMRKSEAEAERGATRDDFERIKIPKSLAVPENARDLLRRIDDDPIAGAPLFEPLRGVWSLREGTIRVLYRVVAEAKYVLVLAIASAEEL
jgi:PHD/YefM family antitoxin component YafN of YafNO toxin-antitoxin module